MAALAQSCSRTRDVYSLVDQVGHAVEKQIADLHQRINLAISYDTTWDKVQVERGRRSG